MLRPLLLLLASCFFLGLSAQENDCSFGLVLSSAQAEVGEEVTIDVTTRQYEDIVALQYSHHWNPAKLRFIEVLYNPDMDISVANFNLQPEFINAGVLNFAYVEATGAGRDLVDGEALYQLRFELLDAAGADVTITDLAGTIEIIHATELILDNFYFLHSQIGPAGSNPSITTACINGQVCNDPDLGRIAINPNGTEEVSADWSGNGGFTATGTEITSLNGGTYQLELTDGNGNTAHGDFYVAFDSGLDVQLSVDADQCGGPADGAINTTVLGGSSNYTYSWSNGETTANLTDIPAGDYSLTVTDVDLDCSIVASATVASFSQILGFFTATSPACSANDDGALTINVEGPPESFPVTYQWSTGETTAEISGLSAGVYFVTVTDANACESVFSYFLQAEELTFSAELIPGACQDGGGEITILLSGAQYSYLWNTGATTATISDLPDGTYTVTVTDETSGCSASEIYELAGEELVVGVAYECFELDGEALTDMTAIVWNSNDGPYTFDWSTGASEVAVALSTVTVPTAGTYSVTVTSASGCVSVQNDLVAPCGGSSVELYLSPTSSSLANGEDRCFAVKANNFNGIGSVQFSLTWDETKLDFLELTNFALEGLSTTNFNTNLTDDGLLAFSWLATDLVNGETLAAGGTLFEVCLAANAEEEATTLIDFANFPTPVEITDVTPEVLNFTTEAATVILNGGTNGSDETELSLDDATVMIGEQFCLPVRVAAFTDVIGMQASISWDPQALQFTGVQAFNLPSLTNASFNEFAEAQLEGILRVLWNSPDLLGVSRSDNEALFELCFIATGDAGDYPVDFVDQPLPLQLVAEDFTEIATATSSGLVTIGSQTTDDVRLRIGSTAVAPGEVTCVPLEAQAFNDIVAMQFSLNWDDDRIRFDELILVDNELGLEESDFNILGFDGTLSLAWIADNILEPVTLAEGTTLFELCYMAQSQEGQAGIIFSTQPTAIEFVRENTLVPFVPTNGTIMVTSDNLVWPGDTNEDGIANNLDVLP
ncbi:MAG: cohesin domain-containing protein, partial [Bacteroidota bacterium]